MDELEQAIKDLREEYAKRVKCDWVFDPLCYALHMTWKKYEKKSREQKNERTN